MLRQRRKGKIAMVEVVSINGTGFVLAPFGNGNCIRTACKDVLATKVSSSEDTPIHIREAMVGHVFPTFFGSGQVPHIPRGSRLAYVESIASVLWKAGKRKAAKDLLALARERVPEINHPMFFFRKGEYQFI